MVGESVSRRVGISSVSYIERLNTCAEMPNTPSPYGAVFVAPIRNEKQMVHCSRFDVLDKQHMHGLSILAYFRVKKKEKHYVSMSSLLLPNTMELRPALLYIASCSPSIGAAYVTSLLE